MSERKDSEQAFLAYLLEHPELTPVIKSTPLLLLIKTLKTQACSMDDLKRKYPQIDTDDLIQMIEILEQLELVTQDDLAGSPAYFLTEKAREFLKRYIEGKKAFDVLGNA